MRTLYGCARANNQSTTWANTRNFARLHRHEAWIRKSLCHLQAGDDESGRLQWTEKAFGKPKWFFPFKSLGAPSLLCVCVCVLLRFDASQLIYLLMARSGGKLQIHLYVRSICQLALARRPFSACFLATHANNCGKSGQKTASAALKRYLFIADGLINLLLTVILMDTHTHNVPKYTKTHDPISANCFVRMQALCKEAENTYFYSEVVGNKVSWLPLLVKLLAAHFDGSTNSSYAFAACHHSLRAISIRRIWRARCAQFLGIASIFHAFALPMLFKVKHDEHISQAHMHTRARVPFTCAAHCKLSTHLACSLIV